MNSVKLRSRVGADGVLNLKVPVGVTNAEVDVVVVFQLVADLVAVLAAEVCAALFLLQALADNAMATTPTTTMKRFIYASLRFDQGDRN